MSKATSWHCGRTLRFRLPALPSWTAHWQFLCAPPFRPVYPPTGGAPTGLSTSCWGVPAPTPHLTWPRHSRGRAACCCWCIPPPACSTCTTAPRRWCTATSRAPTWCMRAVGGVRWGGAGLRRDVAALLPAPSPIPCRPTLPWGPAAPPQLVDENWRVKVSDFGLTKIVDDATRSSSVAAMNPVREERKRTRQRGRNKTLTASQPAVLRAAPPHGECHRSSHSPTPAPAYPTPPATEMARAGGHARAACHLRLRRVCLWVSGGAAISASVPVARRALSPGLPLLTPSLYLPVPPIAAGWSCGKC